MALTLAEARTWIDGILSRYTAGTSTSGGSLISSPLVAGKVYEAWVLCEVLERLVVDEGYNATLRYGRRMTLRSSPGGVNPTFPRFELVHSRKPPLEVWTDVEFLTFSYGAATRLRRPGRTDRHELDIVVIAPGSATYPTHDEIRIGVECKNTGFTKGSLRGILGVRRELSLLTPERPTGFSRWPRRTVPADPPSCLLVFGSHDSILNYRPPDDVFGIDFFHYSMP